MAVTPGGKLISFDEAGLTGLRLLDEQQSPISSMLVADRVHGSSLIAFVNLAPVVSLVRLMVLFEVGAV